jgi:hypothetical protein
MGNQFRVEVKESSEELLHRLRHALTAASKERLQMLYWIKTNAIVTRKELFPSTQTRRFNRVSVVKTLSTRRH